VALKYQRGTIVLVSQVPDKNNTNHKNRFVVLIQDFDDTDTFIYGVAVTGTFSFPLPATSVRLPYHRQGKCGTGLTKACIADCTWLVTATSQEILKRNGMTKAGELVTILQQVQNSLPPPPQQGADATGS
jgi:hypothetical protein